MVSTQNWDTKLELRLTVMAGKTKEGVYGMIDSGHARAGRVCLIQPGQSEEKCGYK